MICKQIDFGLGKWRPAFRKSRMEQVTISWLSSGQIKLTHSFTLKQEEEPVCKISNTALLNISNTFSQNAGLCSQLKTQIFKENNIKDLKLST